MSVRNARAVHHLSAPKKQISKHAVLDLYDSVLRSFFSIPRPPNNHILLETLATVPLAIEPTVHVASAISVPANTALTIIAVPILTCVSEENRLRVHTPNLGFEDIRQLTIGAYILAAWCAKIGDSTNWILDGVLKANGQAVFRSTASFPRGTFIFLVLDDVHAAIAVSVFWRSADSGSLASLNTRGSGVLVDLSTSRSWESRYLKSHSSEE